MLPIYIYTYIHICSMCYWCHWCSTVFFKKICQQKIRGRLARIARIALASQGGGRWPSSCWALKLGVTWTWTRPRSWRLGRGDESSTFCHRGWTGRLTSWRRGIPVGHGPWAILPWQIQAQKNACFLLEKCALLLKKAHKIEIIWVCARSAKPSAWCPPDLQATHPVHAPLGLQILEVHGSPINSKHRAGGSAKRCLPFGITFHSNCAWKWSHQKAVGPPSWRWSGVYSDDTKVCLESLCLYYL